MAPTRSCRCGSRPTFSIADRDPDPRGMPVIGADQKVAGTVKEVWVDRSEIMIRYLEVETEWRQR